MLDGHDMTMRYRSTSTVHTCEALEFQLGMRHSTKLIAVRLKAEVELSDHEFLSVECTKMYCKERYRV